MKTFRFLGMALLAVLMSVGFSSCKGDDDNTPANLEGVWYLKAEIWYAWHNGQPNLNVVTGQDTYGDYSNEEMWDFKKNGNNWSLGRKDKDDSHYDYENLTKIRDNEFRRGDDRLIIQSVTSKKLVVGYYDNFYDDDDDDKEYGVYTFMR